MALSQELVQRLITLKASIKKFMELHNNPHDTSKYNELAAKMEKVEQLLSQHAIGTDTDNGGSDNNASDTPPSTVTIQGTVGEGGANNKADVEKVQALLKKVGASITVDGKIGNQTIATIKNYQRSIGNNNPDGLIEPGKATWTALANGKGNAAGPGAVQPGEKRGIKSVATRYGFTTDKYANQNDRNGIGNNGNKLTQGKSVALSPELYDLLGIGYKSGAYINVEFPNGSVKKFQTADQTRRGLTGLRVDFYDPKGNFKSVDGKTLYVTKVSSSGAVDVAPQPGGDTAAGSGDGLSDSVGQGGANKKADVEKVQTLLNKKGASLTVDGQNGTNTINAIKAFQLSIGNNNPDGLVEPERGTWKALNSGSGDAGGTGTGNGNTSGNSNLSISASVGQGGENKEADVKIVQELLNKKGGKLTVDGKNGNKTIAAIRSFQSSIGISPDGVISPNKNTWKGLIGSTGSVDPNATSGGTAGGGFDPGEPLAAGAKPSSSSFKYSEFISPRDPVREVPREYWGNLQKLMNNLEVIRKALGVSMNINSGYRSPGYNARIGGASRSQHMYGKAADISTSLPASKVHAVITQLVKDGKITPGGVGKYRNFTHYDVRGSFTAFNGGY